MFLFFFSIDAQQLFQWLTLDIALGLELQEDVLHQQYKYQKERVSAESGGTLVWNERLGCALKMILGYGLSRTRSSGGREESGEGGAACGGGKGGGVCVEV